MALEQTNANLSAARITSQAWQLATSRSALTRVGLQPLAAWALGFVPVTYLALRGGGYDTAVYSEGGLAVWWIVLLGLLIGVLPVRRPPRLSWIAMALLGGLALWAALALSWTESPEQTVSELGRLASYLGVFVLGLCALRRETVRPLVSGVATAFGVVSVLAVLSRLYPGAFPTDQVPVFFPGSTSRLDYPFNYANGTGNFLGIGLPLLLLMATSAKTYAGRAVGTAAGSIAILGLVMTASRGGALTAIVGVAVFYSLAPDRLPKAGTGLLSATGGAILVIGLLNRHDLRNGLSTATAVSQRHQMTVLLVVVVIGVALLRIGLAVAAQQLRRPSFLRISSERASRATAVALILAGVIGVAAGLPGQLAHQWQVFKQTDVTGVVSGNIYSRLGTVSGSHRYQYWQAALHAFASKPLTGIGPGTFQFYWEQHGSINEFVRNAHSLYLETLAETGLLGGALIVAFLVTLVGTGIVRAWRAPPSGAVLISATTASLVGFCVAAAFDWVWQLPAVPVAALLLGAAVLTFGPRDAGANRPRQSRGTEASPANRVGRIGGGLAVLAVVAMLAIAIPLGMVSAVRSSQSQVRAGHLQSALDTATTAQELEPYAATPRLQEALVYERLGDLAKARRAIAQATARETTNWQIWLVRARIDAESGLVPQAVAAFRRAHVLNPKSSLTATHV